jgi:hypothetical protein
MEIEEALRAYLLTKTALTALVSTRIFPDDISDSAALPCVVYIKVSDVKDHLLTGQSTLERPVFQFSAYAATKTAVRAITNQLKTVLCDYSGTLSGVVVQKIELQNEMSSLETGGEGASKIYIEDLEFEVNHLRS